MLQCCFADFFLKKNKVTIIEIATAEGKNYRKLECNNFLIFQAVQLMSFVILVK